MRELTKVESDCLKAYDAVSEKQVALRKARAELAEAWWVLFRAEDVLSNSKTRKGRLK